MGQALPCQGPPVVVPTLSTFRGWTDRGIISAGVLVGAAEPPCLQLPMLLQTSPLQSTLLPIPCKHQGPHCHPHHPSRKPLAMATTAMRECPPTILSTPHHVHLPPSTDSSTPPIHHQCHQLGPCCSASPPTPWGHPLWALLCPFCLTGPQHWQHIPASPRPPSQLLPAHCLPHTTHQRSGRSLHGIQGFG